MGQARGKLREYARKRRFEVTPEPGTAPAGRKEGLPLFVVHKHDARRLHYDLRLELDGALASWAIPKGPSYDPSQKRLAVQTEDHPLAYASFEGRIPEGEYGAGDSILWDRGTFDTVPPGEGSQQRKKGHLHLELQGEKLHGRWHLLRTRLAGGKQQWLFFKAKDGSEDPGYDVLAERPESVQSGRVRTRGPVSRRAMATIHPEPGQLLEKVGPPMRATPSRAEEVEEGRYLLEVKYDGYRGLAAICAGRVAFRSRSALDLSERFPDIAQALSHLEVAEAVLDGEVVALDERGASKFQLLQTSKGEERFAAFDLLWLDGEDLRGRPLEERRDLLESVLANATPPIQLGERVDLPLAGALSAAKRRGTEGIVAKRRGSKYRGGRSRDWLKLKVQATQEVAVVGYLPIRTGGAAIGSLLLAVREGRAFHYAGKVGTGFTDRVRELLKELLDRDRVERPEVQGAPRQRGAVWVRPKLVAQVAFSEWTRDGKLRQPSLQGLREDKRPEDCVREEPAEAR